jgi:hypothetical protein
MHKSLLSSFIFTALVGTVINVPVAVCTEEVGKDAKEEMEQFDPQSYTCDQFLTDLASPKGSGQEAGMALIWAHGFHSALFGTDEVGALNEKVIGEIAEQYATYCKDNKKETFSRAAYTLTKDDDDEEE